MRSEVETNGVLFFGFHRSRKLSSELENLEKIAARIQCAIERLDELQRFESALVQTAKITDLALLSAGVAHSIRNPLTVIQSSAEVLKEKSESGDGIEDANAAISDVTKKWSSNANEHLQH